MQTERLSVTMENRKMYQCEESITIFMPNNLQRKNKESFVHMNTQIHTCLPS